MCEGPRSSRQRVTAAAAPAPGYGKTGRVHAAPQTRGRFHRRPGESGRQQCTCGPRRGGQAQNRRGESGWGQTGRAPSRRSKVENKPDAAGARWTVEGTMSLYMGPPWHQHVHAGSPTAPAARRTAPRRPDSMRRPVPAVAESRGGGQGQDRGGQSTGDTRNAGEGRLRHTLGTSVPEPRSAGLQGMLAREEGHEWRLAWNGSGHELVMTGLGDDYAACHTPPTSARWRFSTANGGRTKVR